MAFAVKHTKRVAEALGVADHIYLRTRMIGMIKKQTTLSGGAMAGLLVAVVSAAALAAPPAGSGARRPDAVNRADAQCEAVAEALVEIQKIQATLDGTTDPSSIDTKTVKEMNDQIRLSKNKLDTAERAMRLLPADNADLKAQMEKIAAQRAALAAATESGEKFNKRLAESLAAGVGPQARKDIDATKAMSKAYAPFQLAEDPERAGVLAARIAEDEKTLAARKASFGPLIRQKTPEGKEFAYWAEPAEANMLVFRRRVQIYNEKGEAVIAQTIDKAVKAAEQAAAEKKPAFFTGGVAQQVDMARKNVQAFAAVIGEADPRTAKLKTALAEGEKKIETIKSGLKQEILASTKTPADQYRGADKAQLKSLIEQQWKTLYPADQVVSVRFAMPEWKRKTGATWSSAWKTWEDFDHSEMVARVIVKDDAKLSTLYWVYVNKDHKSNDLITVNAKTKGGLYVVEQMLTANVEQ